MRKAPDSPGVFFFYLMQRAGAGRGIHAGPGLRPCPGLSARALACARGPLHIVRCPKCSLCLSGCGAVLRACPCGRVPGRVIPANGPRPRGKALADAALLARLARSAAEKTALPRQILAAARCIGPAQSWGGLPEGRPPSWPVCLSRVCAQGIKMYALSG